MPPLTESDIEAYALDLLEAQGWCPMHGPDISPGGEHPQRQSFDETLLAENLSATAARLNKLEKTKGE